MDKNLLYIGGGIAALYLVTKGKSTTTNPLIPSATTATNALMPANITPNTVVSPTANNPYGYPYLVANAPAMPSTYNDTYYKTYIYPAMLKVNQNIANPNYQLTPAELNQYKSNYLELQQWLASNDPHSKPFPNGTEAQYLQYHWTHYGPAYQYTFLPLFPPKNVQWTPPPPAPKSSGGGSSWLSVLQTVASVAVAFAGTEDKPLLSDAGVEVLFTGAAITRQMLPIFANSDPRLVAEIDQKLTNVLNEYK